MPNNRHGSLLTSSHTFLQKWVFASDTFSGKVIGDLLIANSVDMSPSLPSWSSWHICYKWPLPPFSFSAPDTTTSLNILSKNSCGSILSIAHILESLSVFLFHSYSFSLLDIYLHLHLILYLYFSSPNSWRKNAFLIEQSTFSPQMSINSWNWLLLKLNLYSPPAQSWTSSHCSHWLTTPLATSSPKGQIWDHTGLVPFLTPHPVILQVSLTLPSSLLLHQSSPCCPLHHIWSPGHPLLLPREW